MKLLHYIKNHEHTYDALGIFILSTSIITAYIAWFHPAFAISIALIYCPLIISIGYRFVKTRFDEHTEKLTNELQQLQDNYKVLQSSAFRSYDVIAKLDKQLNIAKRGLERYADEGNWWDVKEFPKARYACHNHGYRMAQRMLEEIEGVQNE